MCQKDMPGTIFNGLLMDIETLIHTLAWPLHVGHFSVHTFIGHLILKMFHFKHLTLDFGDIPHHRWNVGYFSSNIGQWILETFKFSHWTLLFGNISNHTLEIGIWKYLSSYFGH